MHIGDIRSRGNDNRPHDDNRGLSVATPEVPIRFFALAVVVGDKE